MMILMIFVFIVLLHFLTIFEESYINDVKLQFLKKYTKSDFWFILISITTLVWISVFYYYSKMDFFTAFKYLILIVVLVKLAQIDFKTYTVPLNLLIYLGACRLILLVIEIVLYIDSVSTILLTYGFGIIISLVISLATYFTTKKGIGEGDIILLAIIASFTGMFNILNIYVYTVVMSALIAIYCLVFKKKTIKQSIPMIPSIMLGVVINTIIVYL